MSKIEDFRSLLKISKHNLDGALEVQAEIMDQISQQVVMLQREVNDAKDSLAKLEGRLLIEFKEDGTKLSVGVVDAMIRRDQTRSRAWDHYQDVMSELDSWSKLLDAWKQRGFAIKGLGDLYGASYFTVNSLGSDRQIRRDREHEDRRALMRATAEVNESKSTGTRRRVIVE